MKAIRYLKLIMISLFSIASSVALVGCTSGLNKKATPPLLSSISGSGPVVSDGIAASIITITLLDGNGEPLQGIIPTFDATDTNNTNLYGACSASSANGTSNCTLRSLTKETKQLRLLTPITKFGDSVIFIPGPIDHFVITTQPSSSVIAGENIAQDLVLDAIDITNNLATTASINVTLAAFSDSLCTVPKTGVLTATSNPVMPTLGIVTFSNISFTKTGSLYLQVSAVGATPACTTAINVTHNIAQHLDFATYPSIVATAGVNLATQPSIEVLDTYNNRVITGANASSSITVAAYSNVGCTTPSGTIFSVTQNPVTATTGLAGFSGINTTLAQPTYLKFSAAGITSVCSPVITVSPNTPNTLASTITGTGPIAANGFHASTVTATIYDVYSNPVPGITPTFSATNTGATNSYGACSATSAGGASTCTLTSTQVETKTLSITSPISKSGGTVIFIKPPDPILSVFSATSSITANGSATSTISIQFLDTLSAPVVGLTPVVASTGTGNTISSCSVTDGSGNSTCTMSSTKAEVKTLSLTSPLSLAGPNVTFVHGSAAKVAYLTQPSSTGIAGTSLSTSPAIEIQDANGNRVTTGGGASSAITLSPFSDSGCTAGGAGTLSASTNPLNGTTGLASFSAVNYTLVGAFYIKATSAGLTSACSTLVTISPGAYSAAQSVVTASAGSLISNASVTATLTTKDAFGNLNPTGLPAVGSIAFTSSVVGGTGTYGAITNAGSGVYTSSFTGVLVGAVTLGATISAVAVSNNASVTVNPSTATQLVLSSIPGSSTAGSSFNITVTAKDLNNNTATAYAGTVAITSSDGLAILPASSTLTSGTKVFAVTLKTATSKTVTAGDGTFSVTSSGITVNPAAYDVTQSVVTASAATLLSNASVTATLTTKDAYGNLNPSGLPAVGSIAFTSSAGSGTGTYGAITDAGSGVYTSSFTGVLAGAVTLGATISTVAVSNNASVTVNTGATTQLVLSSIPGSSTAGNSFNITVTAKDINNNVTTGYAGTVSITSSDGLAVLPASSTLTSGTKVFAVTLKTAASKTVTAGDGTLTVTSSGITVNPAAYDVAQSVVTSSAGTVISGASVTATLTTKDAYGNLNPTGLPAVGSIAFTSSAVGGTGTYGAITNAGSGVYTSSFTGVLAGSVTLGATISAAAVSTNASVTVNPGAASSIVFSTQPSASNTAGSTFSTPPAVSVLDANSNLLNSLSTGTISVAVSAGTIFAGGTASISNGIAQFTSLEIRLAGTGRTLTATYSAINSSASDSFDITPAAASKLNFSTEPSSTAQISRNWLTPPAIETTDAYNNRITSGGNASLAVTVAAKSDVNCAIAAGASISAAQNPVTSSSGLASFTSTNYPAAETIYLLATAPSMTSACSAAIDVLHWRSMSTTNAPAARSSPGSAWTGTKLVIWGGKDGSGTALATGATYLASTDTWTATSTTGSTPSARYDHVQIWSGSEVLIWGGQDGTTTFADGARYNPANNTWATIASLNAPTARTGMTATWTGSKLLIFGGRNATTYYDDLYEYDPGLDSWALLSTGLLNARDNLISTFDSGSGLWYLIGGKDGGGNLGDGKIYNTATTGSTAIASEGSLGTVLISTATAVFKNLQLWVYGGSGSASYDPVGLTWAGMTTTNEPTRARSNFMSTITTTGLWMYGGHNGTTSRATGAAWNTTDENWITHPTESTSPLGKAYGVSNWTGTEVLLWGGCSDGPTCSSVSNSGSSFVP